jgi:hypothetical protein
MGMRYCSDSRVKQEQTYYVESDIYFYSKNTQFNLAIPIESSAFFASRASQCLHVQYTLDAYDLLNLPVIVSGLSVSTQHLVSQDCALRLLLQEASP